MAPSVTDRLASAVRVRRLEPEDSLAHLTELLHRAYKQHADRGIKALAAFQPEAVTRNRIATGECFVATHLGKVVGTILFKDASATHNSGVGGANVINWFHQSPTAQGGVASFSQFAVEPDLQGKGIGSVLMAKAEQRAAETGASEIALSTPEPADWLVKMYERRGYRVVEHVQWKETNYTSAIMSKSLR